MRTITKIIGLSLIIPTIILVCIYNSDVNPKEVLLPNDSIKNMGLEQDDNEKTIEITQKDMQLNHEVIQYKIVFHNDDTINVSIHLLLENKNIQKKVFFLILTDGNKSILPAQTDMLYLSYVPMTTIDVTTRNNRFSVGQRLINTILQKGRFGLEKTLKEDRSVKKNDTWYLTIATLTSAEGDITVTLTSQSKSQSMELLQMERHSKLELYSAYDNDFSGTYVGMKLFFFGCSYAKNLNKCIETTSGSIIHFVSGGHFRGDITVQQPDGTITSNNNRFAATYTYHGNTTGQWSFSANGWSILWKHGITLFFIDIDPHFRYA
jgi:hypothetical protein